MKFFPFEKLLIIILALSFGGFSKAGELSRASEGCIFPGGCYEFSGDIVADDLNAFGELLTNWRANKQSIFVSLNSPGGDFYTAIKLGRLFREAEIQVVGGQSDVCISSCVMLMAGAVFRGHGGRVGIHRPYRASTAPVTSEEMRKEFNKWGDEAKSFRVLPRFHGHI